MTNIFKHVEISLASSLIMFEKTMISNSSDGIFNPFSYNLNISDPNNTYLYYFKEIKNDIIYMKRHLDFHLGSLAISFVYKIVKMRTTTMKS